MFQVINILKFSGIEVPNLAVDIALKMIFANAFFNPIFYGLCRSNYRKGYMYVGQMLCCVITCGVAISLPGGEKLFPEI